MRKIMQEDVSKETLEGLQYLDEQESADAIKNIITGNNDVVFTTAVKLKNSGYSNDENSSQALKDETSLAFIIYNKLTDYTILIADFDVSQESAERMMNNNVFYVNSNTIKEEESSECIAITDAINANLRQDNIDSNIIANSLMARINVDNAGINCQSDELARRIFKEICSSYLSPETKQNIDAITLTSKEYNKEIPVKKMFETKER